MAALTITAASVIAATSATKVRGTSGATITAGHIVYLNSSNQYALADADASGIGDITAFYIALNGASSGQPVTVASYGDITLGAIMTAGTAYYLAPTAGGIGPLGDVLSGDDVILLGVAKSTSVLAFKPIIPGVTL